MFSLEADDYVGNSEESDIQSLPHKKIYSKDEVSDLSAEKENILLLTLHANKFVPGDPPKCVITSSAWASRGV